ncbi:pyridoxamine 5'-phosphate oxidase family protein [Natronoglycomyces albus]|uniref:Pyridoxamine 5'-phosphate oxidase family protein n=1 Tax=Natronoglycomyces albus TaxID=2811108 RepID=A0A895XXD5_9ACTN|nr:pyridoxamine 5'-phosphate oxidase family protein [Natronoglycomyces albus]QSB06288.1 pyridoxamine 5'-phosphate oxidase family protein [Natronoglycomyces albus]
MTINPATNPSASEYPQTAQTTARRHRERISYDAGKVHALLDELYYCHAVIAHAQPGPMAMPLFHARVGETLYMHGSTGAGSFLNARDGKVAMSVTATSIDGLVYSRSWFHHSANYRSVIIFGQAQLVSDPEEKWDSFVALVDRLGPGRSGDSRSPSKKELAQTSVLKLSMDAVSYKERNAGVGEDPDDLDLPHWAGVVPLRLQAGEPSPAPGVTTEAPAYVKELHTV